MNERRKRKANHQLGFRVQTKQCSTCIYKPSSTLDLKRLEAEVSDGHGGFKSHRTCHYTEDVCCRGFWNKHKNKFPGGQIAQRLNMVAFIKINEGEQLNES